MENINRYMEEAKHSYGYGSMHEVDMLSSIAASLIAANEIELLKLEMMTERNSPENTQPKGQTIRTVDGREHQL